ncbi:hypothetical protein Pmani_036127 [Petrolisthes manimaculis]|uniref:Uncharacterized protein n=1 Tax=Petrolisthes manimaculis TaxID=1843537 RepID=A0AAE1TN04_9EUCA|nr:hypothetical protein Pmani_036127 [Petrolisthes manimaculis]
MEGDKTEREGVKVLEAVVVVVKGIMVFEEVMVVVVQELMLLIYIPTTPTTSPSSLHHAIFRALRPSITAHDQRKKQLGRGVVRELGRQWGVGGWGMEGGGRCECILQPP